MVSPRGFRALEIGAASVFVTVTFGNAGLGKIDEAMCPLNLGPVSVACAWLCG